MSARETAIVTFNSHLQRALSAVIPLMPSHAQTEVAEAAAELLEQAAKELLLTRCESCCNYVEFVDTVNRACENCQLVEG